MARTPGFRSKSFTRSGPRHQAKGAGPTSHKTSIGKATQVFKNPRKPRKRKGFTHGT